MLNLTLIEQLGLFILGFPLGIGFGMLIARLMGYTASFLAFTPRTPLPVSLEGFSLPLTFVALAFALFSRLWPAFRAARSSLVIEERERARPQNKPFWYRFYLDLILLVPTYYAFDQMSKRGSLAGLITSKPEDLYRDPLLILVPALFILTISLVTMRLFALSMRLLDLLSNHSPWLTLHLALRQLGRQSLDYVQPLLLVIIALSMGVYTLSMASSLDQWTVDRMFYRTGADLTFTPQLSDPNADVFDGSWIPLPQDIQSLPGVANAARVGDFSMHIFSDTSKQVSGRFLAIDRIEFPKVAWFRSDFSREPLGAMMNRLAANGENVLVSQNFLDQQHLRIGDTIPINVNMESVANVSADFVIAGTYNYFPTVFEDKETVIGNIDYLSTITGLVTPHNLWLKLKPGADHTALLQDIRMQQHILPGHVADAQELIANEENRMERVGIFGTLTVGFLATASMAIMGLLVYSYASLQDRSYRLAVLNAVGLSHNQILLQVVMEYAFLALFGALAGALIGIFSSELFVPFFRYTGEKGIPLPPLLPILPDQQLRVLSLIFCATIVVTEIVSISSILHKRLSQILKRVWM